MSATATAPSRREAPPAQATPLAAPPASPLEATPEEIDGLAPDTPVQAALPPQPLPQFLDAAFADILQVPYALGPGVGARRDVIALRGDAHTTRRRFLRLIQDSLRSYGLILQVRGGAVLVSEAAGPAQAVAVLGPKGPEGPVTRTVALHAIRAEDLATLLRAVFPPNEIGGLSIDRAANTLQASGLASQADTVAALAERLDQPRLAGAQVVRLTPIFWSPDAFAKALADALAAQAARPGGRLAAPELVVPLPTTGQVIVVSHDPKTAQAVQAWARELDKPSGVGTETATFIYLARNTEAQLLGSLVSPSVPAPRAIPRQPAGLPGAPGNPPMIEAPGEAPAPAGVLPTGGGIVVDTVGNRILFTGTAVEFARLHGLLVALDTPPQQVMVEVTIAEVTLDDETRVGLEWFFNHSQSNGVLSGGTLGGLNLQAAGLGLKFQGADLQAAFNAFASNSKVNILSRPNLVTRSGGEAQIQVGTDVPIITSQTAASVQSGGNTDVLQTVQYRQTGVILRVKPVVYGGGRVDLELSQEVSSQQPNNNTAIASPLFLNRNVTTKLSMTDGATAVIGGLIDNDYVKANSGVPILKDAPLIGAAFRSSTVNGKKTELVILVTPRLIRDDADMARLARGLTDRANRAFALGAAGSYTLLPWRGPAAGSPSP